MEFASFLLRCQLLGFIWCVSNRNDAMIGRTCKVFTLIGMIKKRRRNNNLSNHAPPNLSLQSSMKIEKMSVALHFRPHRILFTQKFSKKKKKKDFIKRKKCTTQQTRLDEDQATGKVSERKSKSLPDSGYSRFFYLSRTLESAAIRVFLVLSFGAWKSRSLSSSESHFLD